jgi:hypothetical protein
VAFIGEETAWNTNVRLVWTGGEPPLRKVWLSLVPQQKARSRQAGGPIASSGWMVAYSEITIW